MKVLLTGKPEYKSYSIEAGYADNLRHFDHHGEFAVFPCPANNPLIPCQPKAICEISHIDADTFLGLCRLYGKTNIFQDLYREGVHLDEIERIDTNGTSGHSYESPAVRFMVGVGAVASYIDFPRCQRETADVTGYIAQMLNVQAGYYISEGEKAIAKVDSTYIGCKIRESVGVGLWSFGASEPFDPSYPYQFGYDIVIVHRQHFETLSIYCKPCTPYDGFAGKTLAGIPFAGHPKACGSPRGEKMDRNTAIAVFEAILENRQRGEL